MTSVLLTGATTPFGLELTTVLTARDDVERVMMVGAEYEPPAGFRVPDKASYHAVDLLRRRRVWRLLFGEAKESSIDVVVHAAQHRNPHRIGKRASRLHLEATQTLLGMCERHPTIRRFVFRSTGEVYKVAAATPDCIDEASSLNLDPSAPAWVRDKVGADLTVCARMGLSELEIVVLRCAECLAPDMGSQLLDYLSSSVCFHPAGYDPMVNIISLPDLVDATCSAIFAQHQGVFNVPGKDTLPLSVLIRKWGRRLVPVPGPLMTPLYAARHLVRHTEFSYALNQRRFHFNAVLDGRRARQQLGWEPNNPVGALVSSTAG